MEKLKLSKEIDINGEKVNEIDYDLDELKGSCIEGALKSLQKTGYIPAVPELDSVLHACIFAQASDLDYTDIQRLPVKDYMKAGTAVRNFLFADLDSSQQESI